MRYCTKCEKLYDDAQSACDNCGQVLVEPKENDPVLLIETDFMQSTMVEPLLEESKIPYSKIGKHGAGFTVWAGTMFEMYRFYVPYGAYQAGSELLASIFGEHDDVADELPTEDSGDGETT